MRFLDNFYLCKKFLLFKVTLFTKIGYYRLSLVNNFVDKKFIVYLKIEKLFFKFIRNNMFIFCVKISRCTLCNVLNYAIHTIKYQVNFSLLNIIYAVEEIKSFLEMCK